MHQGDDGRWYWSSENFPASEISLRTAAPENVVIIDTTPDRPRVLGEVDLFSAQVLVHQHAIYIHESTQYHVDRLDWGERKAYVHRIDADHYTYAEPRGDPQAARRLRERAASRVVARVHGEVMVASLVDVLQEAEVRDRRERRLGSDRPARDRAPDDRLLGRRRRAAAVVAARTSSTSPSLGAGRALQTVASVLLMVDPRDLGLVTQVRSPHYGAPTVYLYEAVPGGVGPRRATLAAPRRAGRRRGRPRRLVRLRGRLPVVHRAAAGRRGGRTSTPGDLALRLLDRARGAADGGRGAPGRR